MLHIFMGFIVSESCACSVLLPLPNPRLSFHRILCECSACSSERSSDLPWGTEFGRGGASTESKVSKSETRIHSFPGALLLHRGVSVKSGRHRNEPHEHRGIYKLKGYLTAISQRSVGLGITDLVPSSQLVWEKAGFF